MGDQSWELNHGDRNQRCLERERNRARIWGISLAERVRERQEAAGNGLNNQDGRGGCLLFARRNGSMPFLNSGPVSPALRTGSALK